MAARKTEAKAPPTVQVFGTRKSRDTGKALRFFKERGVALHFVDLQEREIAPAELRRFAEAFGLDALLDRGSKAYRDGGLEYLRLGEAQLAERLMDEPALLVQPLLRAGADLGLGWDEARWRAWYALAKA